MKILYVEDDAMNRKVMRALLAGVGMVPDEAVDGAEGLAMIEANSYGVVLMDIRMPRMDGLEAIAHIRARHDAKASVPIIAVTADAGVHMRAQCLAVGATDILHKPVELQRLLALIAKQVASETSDLILA
ncbi:MAG: response regulator [Alphaproteobacteria bacterium]|nr:response regulator [Alphaproteobacteria bacterium]